jgi:branched-chain amino acid transport system ATP-binding protein
LILEVRNIYTSYGLSEVLFNVSLSLEKGEIVAILGRNGVGKTTTFRSIIGLTSPKSGEIIWKSEDITRLRTFQIAQRGIGLVPEDRRIFSELTVWENLDVATKNPREDGWTMEKIYDFFPILGKYRNRKGGYLSGGEQQMLAIARTLVGNPELLLLDEPSEGLAPLIIRSLEEHVLQLRDEGTTVLVSEQNYQFCLNTCSRAYILEKGSVVYTGTIDELKADEETKSRHLSL